MVFPMFDFNTLLHHEPLYLMALVFLISSKTVDIYGAYPASLWAYFNFLELFFNQSLSSFHVQVPHIVSTIIFYRVVPPLEYITTLSLQGSIDVSWPSSICTTLLGSGPMLHLTWLLHKHGWVVCFWGYSKSAYTMFGGESWDLG